MNITQLGGGKEALSGLAAAAFFALSVLISQRIKRRGGVLAEPAAALTYVFFPPTLLLLLLWHLKILSPSSWWTRLLETALGVAAIWVLLTLVKAVFLWRGAHDPRKPRIPVLFVDVLRIALVVLGAMIVVAAVWQHDLTHFLTTLGIGSIVLGLALQETLGNFFSGIALFFERPFKSGDWIKVGDREGMVVEANWRSVRVLSRDDNLTIIPNSVLGRERIENFSQPSPVSAVSMCIGFAYDSAPNEVKRVLLEVLRGAPQVLSAPAPSVRTKDFGDFAVVYELKYFIRDYGALPEIEEEVKTRIWYAARRHDLKIPYPVRMVYKTELPPQAPALAEPNLRRSLAAVALFKPLLPQELEAVSAHVLVKQYGDGERVVEQGSGGDSMFIVHSGHARVTVRDAAGAEREVKRLGPGDFFGEMAALTGEPRSASVSADGDLELLVVDKNALSGPFAARPELVQAIAEVAAGRRSHLEVIRSCAPEEARHAPRDGAGVLFAKIRSFFGMTTVGPCQ